MPSSVAPLLALLDLFLPLQLASRSHFVAMSCPKFFFSSWVIDMATPHSFIYFLIGNHVLLYIIINSSFAFFQGGRISHSHHQLPTVGVWWEVFPTCEMAVYGIGWSSGNQKLKQVLTLILEVTPFFFGLLAALYTSCVPSYFFLHW